MSEIFYELGGVIITIAGAVIICVLALVALVLFGICVYMLLKAMAEDFFFVASMAWMLCGMVGSIGIFAFYPSFWNGYEDQAMQFAAAVGYWTVSIIGIVGGGLGFYLLSKDNMNNAQKYGKTPNVSREERERQRALTEQGIKVYDHYMRG